jgi:hypothetical protein
MVAFSFQRFHRSQIGRVLVYVHHPWHQFARCVKCPAKEAFGRGAIAFGREWKVCPVETVGYRYLPWPDAVGSVCPTQVHIPAPGAGIHLAELVFERGVEFGNMLVRQRIPEIPAHAQTITSRLNGLCAMIGMDFYPISLTVKQLRLKGLGVCLLTSVYRRGDIICSARDGSLSCIDYSCCRLLQL